MSAQGETSIEVGGQSTRLLERGSGDPVVVLHGWGGRIESMTPVIDCLSASFRVVALDLPGFGESSVPSGTWGTADYATFVRDVLGKLGLQRTHFVGHSFGAKTSFYLAATHPSLVDKLVLQGSSGLRTPPSLQARLKRGVSKGARTLAKFGPSGEQLRDALYERIQSSDYRDAGEMRPILVKVVNEDMKSVLPRVQASTLLIWGSDDDAAPLQHGRTMEKLIPDAGLVVFEGAGHFAYLDQPERFCVVVRHFLGVGS
ncbi:MAG: alpha/beta hydrolase [Actinomycetota bacterium]|nr:alpha/beta hydrolase [Actinomycetota bacterium]